MLPLWARIAVGVLCVLVAVVFLCGCVAALLDREARSSLRNFVGQAVLALVSAIFVLGVLSLTFLGYVLEPWGSSSSSDQRGQVVETAFVITFGLLQLGLAILLFRSAFGPPPKWLQELRQTREAVERGNPLRKGARRQSEAAPEKAYEGGLTDRSFSPFEIVATRSIDKLMTILLFSRPGRVVLAVFLGFQALLFFKAIPVVAKDEHGRAFQRLARYEEGIPLVLFTLFVTAVVICGVVLLPAVLAFLRRADGRPVINQRTIRWLAALAGYLILAGLIVSLGVLGWMRWPAQQVHDAWQELTTMPV